MVRGISPKVITKHGFLLDPWVKRAKKVKKPKKKKEKVVKKKKEKSKKSKKSKKKKSKESESDDEDFDSKFDKVLMDRGLKENPGKSIVRSVSVVIKEIQHNCKHN